MALLLRVLLIEDSVDEAELLLHKLRLGGYDPVWQRVATAVSLRTALDETWDVIIVAQAVASLDIVQTIKLSKSYGPDTPIILIIQADDEITAVAAMQAGGHDYIIKGRWARLVPAITREIAEARHRQDGKQAQKELEAHARNLILLNDITRAASGMLDFKQMLQVLADRLGELLRADGCYLSLWDEKQQKPKPAAAYGALRDSYRQVDVQQNEPTFTAHVLQTGRVLAVPDTEATPHLSPRLVAMFPSRAVLALPLIVADQKLGAALISFNEPHVFSQGEITKGKQAAGQIALAVAKAHLLDAERKQRALAETLREITHVLTSSLEPAEVLELILDQLARVLTFDSASVYSLVGQELHQLVNRTIYDRAKNPVLVIKRFKHIVEVLATRKPVIIDNTRHDPRWLKLVERPYTHCWLGVPLIAHNEVIGILNITHSEPYFYEPHDAEIAMAFANQAATAIENANLYERLRHHAQNLEIQVTERTRELAQANEQLKELDHLKTKFISDVSHELRTPITNLKLYLSLLNRGAPQKREQYLGVINHQTDRLEALIKDILNISRLEAGGYQLTIQPLNFRELVEYTVVAHRQRAELAGLQLKFQPDSSLPLIRGDVIKLQQVVENLITNAIQYTPSGMIDICMFVDQGEEMVCLQISDTGIGVSEEELPLLYERFYRGEKTGQLNIPGTGLGLSIAKEIVDMHNGRIEVESKLDQGSTFRVWLPISNPIQGDSDGRTTSVA